MDNKTAKNWKSFIQEYGYISNTAASHMLKYMNMMAFYLKAHVESSAVAKNNLTMFTTINNALKLTPKMVMNEQGVMVHETIELTSGKKIQHRKQYVLDNNNNTYVTHKHVRVKKDDKMVNDVDNNGEPVMVEVVNTCIKLINGQSDFKSQLLMILMVYISDCKDILDMEPSNFTDFTSELDNTNIAKVIVDAANHYDFVDYFKVDTFNLTPIQMELIQKERDRVDRTLHGIVSVMYNGAVPEYDKIFATRIVETFKRFLQILVVKIMPYKFCAGKTLTCNRKVINGAMMSIILEIYKPGDNPYDYAILAYDDLFKPAYDNYITYMKEKNIQEAKNNPTDKVTNEVKKTPTKKTITNKTKETPVNKTKETPVNKTKETPTNNVEPVKTEHLDPEPELPDSEDEPEPEPNVQTALEDSDSFISTDE